MCFLCFLIWSWGYVCFVRLLTEFGLVWLPRVGGSGGKGAKTPQKILIIGHHNIEMKMRFIFLIFFQDRKNRYENDSYFLIWVFFSHFGCFSRLKKHRWKWNSFFSFWVVFNIEKTQNETSKSHVHLCNLEKKNDKKNSFFSSLFFSVWLPGVGGSGG